MSDTFSGADVLAAVAAATGERAWIDQTGGGVATAFVGEPRPCGEYGEAARLAIGPGTFDWADSARSTFYAADLNVGPDDWGERPAVTVATLADLTAAVRDLLARPDWREDAR